MTTIMGVTQGTCILPVPLLLLALSSAITLTSAQVPSVEVNALFELHKSTNGENWLWRNESLKGPKWDFSQDMNGNFMENPCSSGWQGVTCSLDSHLCFNQSCHITEINLSEYGVEGLLPKEISRLGALTALLFETGGLNSTIPPQIGDLLNLQVLSLEYNSLTGSIPSEIGKLLKLEVLDLDDNSLTGPMPVEIGDLVSLRRLDFDNNLLTGSISSTFGKLVLLEVFDLESNSLTGSIPSEISSWTNLERLDIERNSLSGSIPKEIGNLVALRFIDLEHNALTGSIPGEVGNLVRLGRLDFDNNALIGPIPSEIGNLAALRFLDLDTNSLSGSIPSELGGLLVLEGLDLGHNALTGTVPKEISRLGNLLSCLLQSNSLMGSIDGVFDSSIQLRLSVLDLSNNLLTGNYAGDIFQLPQLQVLTLSVNCFQDELPATAMCEASTVEVLSLNGLGAAKGCLNTVKFPFSDVSLFNTIGGTLPECVWHLKNLTVLHVAGNELSGKVIAELPYDSRLNDLSLSHNMFSGEVPLGVYQLQRIDMSYNQFSGRYEDEHADSWVTSLITLEINRLSGDLSDKTLQNVSDLNILRGNMFSCGGIPDNYEFVEDYICGATDLDESLYVLGSVLILTGVIALTTYLAVVGHSSPLLMSKSTLMSATCFSYANRWWMYSSFMAGVQADGHLKPLVALKDKYNKITWCFIKLFFVMLVVAAPIYLLRWRDDNGAYSTHTNTYTWFWTLAYTHGVKMSSTILASWFITIGACFYVIRLSPRLEENSEGSDMSTIADDADESKLTQSISETATKEVQTSSWLFAVLLLNAGITIVVNVLYIYSIQQPMPAIYHFGVRLSLAVFKLAYSYFVFPIVSRPVVDVVSNIGFRFRLLVVNNLLIPCLVTMFASPSCFQGLVVSADAVSTPFSYEACSTFYIFANYSICTTWETVEIESAPVIPPFAYNHQCASVLLTSYIPVFIMGFSIQIALIFIVPMLLFQTGKLLGLRVIIHRKGILWPEFWLNDNDTSPTVRQNKTSLGNDPMILLSSKSVICFDILNNIMLLLTFGLCSPILAVAVSCAVVLKMKMLILLVGRFTAVLTNSASSAEDDRESGSDKHGNSTGDSSAKEEDLHFALLALTKVPFPVVEVLRHSFWLITWTSSIFISLVCWDIAGDDVGWAKSCWIPVVAMSYPPLLWVIDGYVRRRGGGQMVTDRGKEMEKKVKVKHTTITTEKTVELKTLRPAPMSTAKGAGAVHLNPIHSS